MRECNVSELLGLTLSAVARGDDVVTFTVSDGRTFNMFHRQDCCEGVYLDDVCGDLQDLVGSPITQAEENSNSDPAAVEGSDPEGSFTWTFYRFATAKGPVVLRWFGSSNGYYSESVSFAEQ